jgi:hypothetical protein
MITNNNINQNNIEKTVLEKIKAGKVSMKPRAYFILSSVIVGLVILLIILVTSFLISYALFAMQSSGKLFLLGFGVRGIFIFLSLFPWGTLLVEVVLITLLERILRQYPLGYKNPFFYVLSTSIVVIVFFAVILNLTHLHSRLLWQEKQKQLPVLGAWYENIESVPPVRGVFRGEVVDITGDTVILRDDDHEQDRDDGVRTVLVTRELENGAQVKRGDRVYAAGRVVNGEIRAYGLKKIPPKKRNEIIR